MESISIQNRIRQAEEILLSLLLCAMIGLAVLQIVLRMFFDSGLIWADPLLRNLVIWSGLLGAVLAVSQNKHISLDIFSHILPSHIKRAVALLIQLFSAIVTAFLTYASLLFIQTEIEFGSTTLLAIPSWALNLIFPFAFAVMTIRYLAGAVTAAFRLLQPPPKSQGRLVDDQP